MRAFDGIEEALLDLQELREILEPRMRRGETPAVTLRRLLESADGPKLVPSPAGSPLSRYKTSRQLVEECPGLTQGSMKWMLFHAATNGLEEHVLRIGRKVLINEDGFLVWLKARKKRAV